MVNQASDQVSFTVSRHGVGGEDAGGVGECLPGELRRGMILLRFLLRGVGQQPVSSLLPGFQVLAPCSDVGKNCGVSVGTGPGLNTRDLSLYGSGFVLRDLCESILQSGLFAAEFESVGFGEGTLLLLINLYGSGDGFRAGSGIQKRNDNALLNDFEFVTGQWTVRPAVQRFI